MNMYAIAGMTLSAALAVTMAGNIVAGLTLAGLALLAWKVAAQ